MTDDTALSIKSGMRTRRDPFKQTKTHLTLEPSAGRLKLLSAFLRYETLPTSYLHKLVGKQYGKDLITDLNDYGYIRISPPSTRRLDARNKEALWEITPKGEAMLGQPALHTGDHYQHKAHRTLARFSFDLCPEVGLERRSLEDIVSHEKCPPFEDGDNPAVFKVGEATVVPDEPLSGFYNPKTNRYFYFFLEADGGTETRVPKTEAGQKKKNIQKMIRLYRNFFDQRLDWKRYRLDSISLFIITKNDTDKNSILRVIRDEVPKNLWHFFAVKVVPDFTEAIRKPTPYLIEEEWETVDATLHIPTILGGANGRTETQPHSGAETRAGQN